MKKAFIIFSLIAIIIACNSNEKDTSTDSATTETAVEDPEAEKGLALVAKSDCFTCHKVAEVSVGPAYEAVAARYPDNDAVIDSLAGKIIDGGTGNWGTLPMTPHPDISQEDAKTMVKYILSLK
ncbi:MAG: c-type cytochrome [Flavisolibacter sp.]|jgi:cytochrome c|nr:c-type cytochrome [Flavisolibacter sp.]